MKLEKIARDIGIFGLVSAILIFVALIIKLIVNIAKNNNKSTGDNIKSVLDFFLISITILVVAIPEGLPLAVTLSLAFSVNKMMDDKNLVRKL